MHGKTLKKIILLPFMVWLCLLVVLPLFLIVYYAFTSDDSFTFLNFANFASANNIKVLVRSLYLAAAATAICLLLGYPIALILSGSTFKKKTFLLVLLIAPMWMNFLLRTYAWLTLLEGSGVINTLLRAAGLAPKIFLGNEGAVVFGMVYNFLPYMIFPIYTTISKIPYGIYEAAYDLGANERACLSKITIPLSLPGVLSGITMVFVPGVTTFVISQFLGSGNVILIGDLIEQQFNKFFNWGFGAAISLIVMLVVLICMWLINRFTDEPEVTMP